MSWEWTGTSQWVAEVEMDLGPLPSRTPVSQQHWRWGADPLAMLRHCTQAFSTLWLLLCPRQTWIRPSTPTLSSPHNDLQLEKKPQDFRGWAVGEDWGGILEGVLEERGKRGIDYCALCSVSACVCLFERLWYQERLDHDAGCRAVRQNRTEQAKVGSNKVTGLFSNKKT